MRLGLLLTCAAVALLVLACADEGESSDLPEIPTPAAPILRDSCETIAKTDYFLNQEEEAWFTENCNRLDCEAIRGTQYVSLMEREWFLDNCI